MRVYPDKNWSFIQALEEAWKYYSGFSPDSRGRRLDVLRTWGCVVGKKRALQEFDHAINQSGFEEIANQLEVAISSLKRLRTYYSKLPDDAVEIIQPIRIKMVLNQPLSLEEDRQYEFKDIQSSSKPVDSIKNTADEYAVAYLNSEGGSIFWGIKDSDRTVCGVKLNYQERDHLRREVSQKLAAIQPSIDPTAYRIELHNIYQNYNDELAIDDLYIVELTVPSSNSIRLHFTGGNQAFVKVDGVKRKLTGPEIQDWIMRRLEDNKGELEKQILMLLRSWSQD